MIAPKNILFILSVAIVLSSSTMLSAQEEQLTDTTLTRPSPAEVALDTRMVADTHELGHVIWKDSPVLAMLDSMAAMKYYGE